MPREQLGRIFSELYDKFEDLSRSEQDRMLEIMSTLASFYLHSSFEDDEFRSHIGDQISAYLLRKVREPETYAKSKGDIDALRMLRNNMVHGSSFNRNRGDILQYDSLIWRTITRSANKWHPVELSNFLAYCTGTSPNVSPFGASQKKIINSYKKSFENLSLTDKERALQEIVLRLYSDPGMRHLVESQ